MRQSSLATRNQRRRHGHGVPQRMMETGKGGRSSGCPERTALAIPIVREIRGCRKGSRPARGRAPARRRSRDAPRACSLRASARIEAVVRVRRRCWSQGGDEQRRPPNRALLLSPRSKAQEAGARRDCISSRDRCLFSHRNGGARFTSSRMSGIWQGAQREKRPLRFASAVGGQQAGPASIASSARSARNSDGGGPRRLLVRSLRRWISGFPHGGPF